MSFENIRDELVEKGLKVTPQRLAVLDALKNGMNHPTADQIIAFVKQNNPNIATGTIYKILETFVKQGMVKKVKTENDVMRYDAILETHHHLYSSDSNRIDDYYDQELNDIIQDYFANKNIPDFEIEDFKLQIIGKFTNSDDK